MSIREMFLGSPHKQLAIAEGISIIAMACASKWMTARPIGYLSLAFPPFLMVIYESVAKKHGNSRICTPWYWFVAILLATVLVIGLHMF